MKNNDHPLITELNNTAEDLLRTLSGFSEAQLNIVPFENSWTGGQVAEHLILSGGVTGAIYGNTAPAHRQPDANVATIGGIFLDFSTRLNSPDFIVPRIAYYWKKDVLEKLQTIWTDCCNAAQTMDLSALCLDFELPGMGQLTRLEWLYFYCFHTQRHIRQLEKIYAALMVPA